MNDAWKLVAAFLSGPETNGLAQAFVGMMGFVIGWRFIMLLLENVPALSGDHPGRRTVRGILVIALSVLLGFVAAVAVGMLARRS